MNGKYYFLWTKPLLSFFSLGNLILNGQGKKKVVIRMASASASSWLNRYLVCSACHLTVIQVTTHGQISTQAYQTLMVSLLEFHQINWESITLDMLWLKVKNYSQMLHLYLTYHVKIIPIGAPVGAGQIPRENHYCSLSGESLLHTLLYPGVDCTLKSGSRTPQRDIAKWVSV